MWNNEFLYSHEDCRDALKRLDNMGADVSEWEEGFIEDNLNTTHFSDKQKEVIEDMATKYKV